MKVTGLQAGTYEVKIDGVSAGKVSTEELGRGWNFANAPGPISEQAGRVLKGVFEKNNVYYKRWRAVQLFEFPKWARVSGTEEARAAELARLDKEIEKMEAEINEDRKPKILRIISN